jgi:hypothetical protein
MVIGALSVFASGGPGLREVDVGGLEAPGWGQGVLFRREAPTPAGRRRDAFTAQHAAPLLASSLTAIPAAAKCRLACPIE